MNDENLNYKMKMLSFKNTVWEVIYFIFECIYLQNSNVTAKSHALLGKKM